MPPRAPLASNARIRSPSLMLHGRKSMPWLPHRARCGENNICMEGLEKIKLKQSMGEGEEKMCESGYSMAGKP